MGQTRFVGSGVWVAEDDDPQFHLAPPQGRLIPGVYEIAILSSTESETPLRPKLYFDVGGGFNESSTAQLSLVSGSAFQLVTIPPRTVGLRFDPMACAGRFVLHDIRFRRLGTLDILSHIARQPARRRAALAAFVAGDRLDALSIVSADARRDGGDNYAGWLARYEPSGAEYLAKVRTHVAAMSRRPLISVVMPVYDTNISWLRAAVDSVRGQAYANWELCVADDASPDTTQYDLLRSLAAGDPRIKVRRLETNGGISAATNAALGMASGEWIAFMDHDDLIRPDALALIADEAVRNDRARIIYTDEDQIDETGARTQPYMKGGWNRELFYTQNYLNHFTAVHHTTLAAAGPLRSEFDGSQDYDLVLRCIEQLESEDAIVHLPFVCYHWRFATHRVNFSHTQGDRAFEAGLRALNDHFRRTEAPAIAEQAKPGLKYARARWRLDQKPLVTLIIPTRDRKTITEAAINSIRRKTAYPNYEILVVDNDSREPDALKYFASLEREGVARIIRAPGAFNFSRINNIAAREARGEILGFLNNDIEIRNSEWLDEMTSHFARNDVGAVGAKLYYPDGRIQHAGVVCGIGGVAGHLFKLAPGDAPGPFSQLELPRETSCVTAACLLMRAELFRSIGGFDEERLAVAFNDVDLCLKARRDGARIVWTPFAELTHFESVSRGADTDSDKQERFQREVQNMWTAWGKDWLGEDPYYSPSLTIDQETGALATPPRAKRPWG